MNQLTRKLASEIQPSCISPEPEERSSMAVLLFNFAKLI